MSGQGDATRRVVVWDLSVDGDVRSLWQLVHNDHDLDALAVVDGPLDVGDALDELGALLDEPLAGSVSPMPVDEAPSDRLERYRLSTALPPPPSLALPCARCVAFDAAIVRITWPDEPEPSATWREAMVEFATRMVDRGWRHVAAPGVALRWTPDAGQVVRRGGWTAATVEQLDGPANESLSTHRLWGATRRKVRVLIDAPCLDGDMHSGTQALVANVAQAMVDARPDASVSVAVRRSNRKVVSAKLDSRIALVDRGADVAVDVVYRPYQLLQPYDLPWLTRVGQRFLVGQLDMIGFANASYHPSPALFHAVRNLQRHTMRVADGVTFISDFGRRHALVECPDIAADRCYVVSSGAATPDRVEPDLTPSPPNLLCLSALFWHKNRELAIRTFATLATDYGYEGELRIAGPEPFYGSSARAEADLLASLAPAIRDRVRHLGRVDAATKWSLLAQADLVVYPSIVEGFGMVPFEAASVGTASLVATGSALAEVFEGTGAVVPSWDDRTWAARAAELIADAPTRERVVDAVRARAATHSWSMVADATWAAIDDVLARPRARLHRDEGGPRSRVAPRQETTIGASAVHFANRIGAYMRRQFERPDRADR